MTTNEVWFAVCQDYLRLGKSPKEAIQTADEVADAFDKKFSIRLDRYGPGVVNYGLAPPRGFVARGEED